VYPSVRSIPPVEADQKTERHARVLSQNLLALGFTSFFSDISSEMVVAIVPLFLTTSLGFSLFGFAAYEAAYQGTNAVFRIWGGSIADNRQSHKKTAATGYSISAATRVGLVASALIGWLPAVPFLLADRIGKGLRTAPRDALISLSTAPTRLAAAFGVHRAMDTAGALLGPLVAFLVLTAAPGAFDAVFVISAMFAFLGVAVIWMFAQEKPQRSVEKSRRPRILDQWREVKDTSGVAGIATAVGLLSVVTVGDAFIYLILQQQNNFSARFFPLLFVGTALAYLLLAVPFGRLADRIGTKPVFLAGNVLLIVMYLVLAFSGLGLAASIAALCLLGAYYAATDGVVPAMVSQLVGSHIRASGIAFITVVIAVARMISALVFATLFETLGRTTTMVVLGVAMTVAVVLASKLISSREALADV
jgi:MFS family permease